MKTVIAEPTPVESFTGSHRDIFSKTTALKVITLQTHHVYSTVSKSFQPGIHAVCL